MEMCELCGGLEARADNALLAPCDCYKKHEDRGRIHPECLKLLLADRALELERGGAKCPTCRVEYRVSVFHRFVWDWQHLLSFKACAHAMEIGMLCTISLMTIFSLTVLDWREEGQGAVYVIVGMFAVTMLFAAYTMLTLFRRWRNAASDMEVSEV